MERRRLVSRGLRPLSSSRSPSSSSSTPPSSSSKSSKSWIQRHKNDIYVQKSTKQNLRSRAIFKLNEIQEKHHFITPSSLVLDLGAAPGGWSLAASKIVDQQLGGQIFAIDLLPFQRIDGVVSFQGNFLSKEIKVELQSHLNGRSIDVILSDMLQNTTGDHDRDHSSSMELTHHILDYSKNVLKKNGTFLGKYLRGSDEKEMISRVKEMFVSHKIIKPLASRQESSEIYILCQGKK
jgi:23S rRNA (uridine2552-2'-O)-methyltransferase